MLLMIKIGRQNKSKHARHVIWWIWNNNATKISHNYANVKTINQLKSLLGFRVVTSLDGINCQFIQTLLKGEDDSKTSNRLKFRLGKPMVLVQNWKLLLGLFSDKIGLEIIFDDHLVRKQALLDYKKADFTK